jgi:hypothetical protein
MIANMPDATPIRVVFQDAGTGIGGMVSLVMLISEIRMRTFIEKPQRRKPLDLSRGGGALLCYTVFGAKALPGMGGNCFVLFDRLAIGSCGQKPLLA